MYSSEHEVLLQTYFFFSRHIWNIAKRFILDLLTLRTVTEKDQVTVGKLHIPTFMMVEDICCSALVMTFSFSFFTIHLTLHNGKISWGAYPSWWLNKMYDGVTLNLYSR